MPATNTTKSQTLRILAAFTAIYEAIKELKVVPSGVLYANLSGAMSLDNYQVVITKLVAIGSITVEANHLIRWKKQGRPYPVARISEESWLVDGLPTTSLDEACDAVEACDGLRGATWDFSTRGECQDGLEALDIGETLNVTPIFDEEDEDDAVTTGE